MRPHLRPLPILRSRSEAARLAAIVEIQRDVASAELEFESVMELICGRTRDLTRAEGATIQLVDGDEIYFGAVSGLLSDRRNFRTKMQNSLSGWTIQHGEAAKCDDMLIDPRVDPRGARQLGLRSMVCVPLFHGGETVGVLQVLSGRPHAFSKTDLETLELLSVVLSSALSHAAEFEAKRKQVEALARFEAVYDGAPIGIALVDRRGRIVECNRTLSEILGYTESELVGGSLNDFAVAEDITEDVVAFDQLMHGERDAYRIEKRYHSKSGDLVWGHVAVSAVKNADDEPEFAIEMIEDISERKHAEEELRRHAKQAEHDSLHDALTGLPNRVLFQDRISQAVLTAEREGGRLGVLILDLDRFKEINDTLGHAAGDRVLKVVAQRLHDCLRASDTVARLGGDEFGLLLPKQNDPAETVHLLDKLSAAIEEPVDLDGLPLGIEGSVGVAFYPDHGSTVEDLVKQADVAMYTAKQENRPYAFYEHADDHHDPIRLSLVGELRRAIDERQLVLYYQPKAQLEDGSVRSVEALLRWLHPERGLIPPDRFIPQAQETGLMKPLTMYVLDEALRQVKAWEESGLDLAVSVNLATRNLIDIAFPDDVAAALERAGVAAKRLELEITESTMLDDPFRTKIVLDKLHAMGIRLSIDDFGTGYSSLAYLRQLPVDEIKIDRSFVLNMHESEDDAVIVRSTIDLGRNLGLQVVAEGVETEAHWRQLTELGCELAQGYFLSRPVPAADLERWLLERTAAPDRIAS